MPDTNVAPTGAETTITVTLNGVPKIISGQIDGFTVKEESTIVQQMPLGTMNVPTSKDQRGWSGTMSCKPTNPTLAQVADLIDASVRLGVPSEVVITHTTRYRDTSKTTHKYSRVVLSGFSTSAKRGESVSTEVTWQTGYPRVSS